MGDLRERLRALDSVTPPDQWEEIRSGTPRILYGGPSIGRRVAVAAAALLIFGGGLTLAALAFMGPNLRTGLIRPGPTGRASGQSPVPSPKPIEVSAVSKDGMLRCTVRLPSDVVAPGEVTGISYTLQNLGSRPLRNYASFPGSNLVVVDDQGKTLWDSSRVAASVRGGFFPPSPVAPGASIALRAWDTPIRWPGPLTLRTSCVNDRVVLPPFRVDVAVPGATPATADAITRAASLTGGLFDDCLPGLDGSTTVGLIHVPASVVPPMRARCSAVVTRYSGFAVVSLMIVTPPDAAPVYEAPSASLPEFLSGLWPLPGHGSMEVARVVFVVTASAVREVEPLQAVFRERASDGMAPTFELRNGQLSRSGSHMCGGGGGGGGIAFISACHA
jgi:hypothetical protein